MHIDFFQSENLQDYRPILEGLVDDFGYDYYHAILAWCKVIDPEIRNGDNFWEVWLIRDLRGKVIGISGLYSLNKSTEDLWLGWLGILPEYRNKGVGERVLESLEIFAIINGAKNLWTYVDRDGKPLSFYNRNGFKQWGRVKKYLKMHPELKSEFGHPMDYILKKKLD